MHSFLKGHPSSGGYTPELTVSMSCISPHAHNDVLAAVSAKTRRPTVRNLVTSSSRTFGTSPSPETQHQRTRSRPSSWLSGLLHHASASSSESTSTRSAASSTNDIGQATSSRSGHIRKDRQHARRSLPASAPLPPRPPYPTSEPDDCECSYCRSQTLADLSPLRSVSHGSPSCRRQRILVA